MKKLTKEQLAERDEIVVRLNDTHDELTNVIEKYNLTVRTAYEEVEAALVKYNEVVADANTWQEEIQGEIENYTSERSEKWQEGDAASQYQSWYDSFDAFDDASVDEPADVEIPESVQGDLEGRPTSVDEA